MSRQHVFKLIISILLAHAAGLIGTFFTVGSVETWYATLAKPSFAPPDWVFGPVWTILYTLIGIAFFFVWSRYKGGHRRTLWIRLFLVHLILNSAWSILFFGMHQSFFALIDIAILILFVLALVGIALRFEKRAAYLLLPYLAWIGFATYLNYSIWQLNK